MTLVNWMNLTIWTCEHELPTPCIHIFHNYIKLPLHQIDLKCEIDDNKTDVLIERLIDGVI